MKDKIKQLKRLSNIKEGEEYVISANEVSKALNKHRESVYKSRRGDNKLDKLCAFEKMKEILKTIDVDELCY